MDGKGYANAIMGGVGALVGGVALVVAVVVGGIGAGAGYLAYSFGKAAGKKEACERPVEAKPADVTPVPKP